MVLMLPKWDTFVCNPLLFWPSVCNPFSDKHVCKGPISMTRPCSISSATNKIERIIREPAVSRYGFDDGLLEHCEALLEKVNSLFLNWEMRTRFWIRGNLLLVGKFSERFTIKVETFWKIYYKSWNFLIQFSSRLTHPSPHKTPLKGPHVRPIAWQHLGGPKIYLYLSIL